MSCSTKKSAIAFIPCREDIEELTKNVNEVSFMFGEEKVPVVAQYKYLGFEFHDSLESKPIIKAITEAGSRDDLKSSYLYPIKKVLCSASLK